MSTFLQLVQDLHRESGAAGAAPTSVVGQSSESLRLVNWIRQADDHINDMWVRWKYLRSEYQDVTVQDQPTLPPPNDLNTWDIKTFKIVEPTGSLTEDKEQIDVEEYEQVRTEILDETSATPFRIIIMPDNTLKFESVPDGAYTVFADYYRIPANLVNNTDEPEMPKAFRQVILGYALQLYGKYEKAEEIITQGKEIYGLFFPRLENHQLPNQNYSRFNTGNEIEVIGGQ